jgi:O-antigen ligase
LADAGRLSAYVIAIRSILDTPLLGFGYGTFEDVFRMYRDQSIGTFEIWDRAHNTYLEVWQGLGLVFGSALIGAVFWLVVKCFRGALKRRRDATPAIVAAAVSLLVGVHALVDFSAQMEAIALTFMVILGAGVAQSDSSKRTISD